MKKSINQLIALAQILSACKVTAVTDNKQKFALVRLINSINPVLENFDKAREQASKMFENDVKGYNSFLTEELSKEQEIAFDGISDETYEQLCSGNDSLTLGQLSVLSILVKE